LIPRTVLSSLLALLALVPLACTPDPLGGSSEATAPASDPNNAATAGDPTVDPAPPGPPAIPEGTTFVAARDHAFFPLVPGSEWRYAGFEDGLPRREDVSVLKDPAVILGVSCAVLVERVHVSGELTEMTTQYYAQDDLGNVWRFGEESIEYDHGVGTVSADSWVAGVDGEAPFVVLGADPQPGDVYAADRPLGGSDLATVLALDATATVPAGTFTGCLDVEETNTEDPEDKDRILYAPGVGQVSEESPSGRIDLVSFGVR
jgi:hypothetical protein